MLRRGWTFALSAMALGGPSLDASIKYHASSQPDVIGEEYTMKRIRRVFVAALMCVPILALAQQKSPVAPQPLSIVGASTHVYKSIDGAELRLHAFSPANHASSMRRPAILFFFGGGWTRGNVEQFVPVSRHLVERGMVAIVVDYRVWDRHGTSPFEAMADAKSAIRWVRSRARELGVDPDRIAASGGSSGGHIALSAAVFGNFDEPQEDRGISSKPNALILFNPAVDTSMSKVFSTRTPGREKEGSPLHHIGRNLPPTIIFHGKADTTIPYAHVERYCLEVRKLANQCELIGYEGAPHGFFNPQVEGGKWYTETLMDADRFLTALGYLPKPTPSRIEVRR
jgi:acetyl esterase